MAYSAVAVANAFIQRALNGDIPELTPMKLQKLMFYAQSWSLKIYDAPIFDDFFAKWRYGPVIPSLYHKVKMYGANNITSMIVDFKVESGNLFSIQPTVPDSDVKINALVDKIVEVYGELRGTQLSFLTHQPGTAWYRTEKDSSVITNELLKECIE
ncbi:Panacea domain-containing protein [Morganella sp. B601]|uniref:Panacea domain-containing protein n=1 Tax=Morganella sp. B601 TaxID=3444315 RepID=UPI003EC04BCD